MVRYATDVLMWCWCWFAWCLVGFLPYQLTRWAWDWLLPFAGYYGYHDPEFTSWRWSERVQFDELPE